jgi:hypothetical protein
MTKLTQHGNFDSGLEQSEIDRMFGDLTEKEAEGLVKELYEGV